MKTNGYFNEANITSLNNQIDAQVKRHKAIKDRTPQANQRKERIRDTIERMRDRRNKLSGNPRSEPVESYDPLQEKAVSKSQQRLMGMALAYKNGDMPNAPESVKSVAKMKKKDLEDFAKTKHKGLPEKVDEAIIPNIMKALRGFDDAKVRKHVETLSTPQLEKIARLASPKSARRVLSPKDYAMWDAAYRKLNSSDMDHDADNAKKHRSVGEALDLLGEKMDAAQRRKRGMIMKRNKNKLKIAREKASRKHASSEKLMQRAKKHARAMLFKKLAKAEKGDLSASKKSEIEARLEKMGPRIDAIAKKLLPKMRELDRERHRAQ